MLTKLSILTLLSFGFGLAIPLPNQSLDSSTNSTRPAVIESVPDLVIETTIVDGVVVTRCTDAKDIHQRTASATGTPSRVNKRATVADLQDSHVI